MEFKFFRFPLSREQKKKLGNKPVPFGEYILLPFSIKLAYNVVLSHGYIKKKWIFDNLECFP